MMRGLIEYMLEECCVEGTRPPDGLAKAIKAVKVA